VRRLALLAAALVCAACGASSGSSGATATPSPGAIRGTFNVFAATSLTAAFKDEATAFMAKHPGVTVNFNFAGSSDLATQIDQGAPADVFASADATNLNKVGQAGNLDGSPATLAANKLEIVVAPGNPKHINGLPDLARTGVVVVLCAPSVPCGNYARQALTKAGVDVIPRSDEQNVGGVLSKVESGDADAGIVYTTDVMAAGGKASGVAIADQDNVLATYPIAKVKGGSNPIAAQAFIAFLLSAQGQAILEHHGFIKP